LVTQTAHLPETMADLKTGALYHFLSYNQLSRTYHLVNRHLSERSITVHPTFYSTSPEIMLQLVLAHRAVAALPYLLVRRHVQEGSLARIKIGESSIIARRMVSLHRSGRVLPAQATALISQTQEGLARLAAEAANNF
jgi:DNA-binding transcriptional LysR family regulator